MSKAKLKGVGWCSIPVNIPGVPYNNYESETAFQIYCADWLRKQAQITGKEGFQFWHHSANEREGGKSGFKAKMMGQAKGWPDFVHCGLRCALELKVMGNDVTRDQAKWLAYFSGLGWTSSVVRTFEEFRDIVLGLVLD